MFFSLQKNILIYSQKTLCLEGQFSHYSSEGLNSSKVRCHSFGLSDIVTGKYPLFAVQISILITLSCHIHYRSGNNCSYILASGKSLAQLFLQNFVTAEASFFSVHCWLILNAFNCFFFWPWSTVHLAHYQVSDLRLKSENKFSRNLLFHLFIEYANYFYFTHEEGQGSRTKSYTSRNGGMLGRKWAILVN